MILVDPFTTIGIVIAVVVWLCLLGGIGSALDRIADAMERIADAMEEEEDESEVEK